MKRAMRKILPALTWLPAALGRRWRGPEVRILMYHRITDQPAGRLCVRPSEFEKQMDLIRDVGYPVLDIAGLQRLDPNPPKTRLPAVVLTFDDGYRDFFDHAFPVLKARHFPAALFIVPAFTEGRVSLGHSPQEKSVGEAARWEMLREIASSGLTIGSHSLTHRELTSIPPSEAGREIRESAEIIEKKLGRRPEWFAYPRGKYNAEIEKLVRAAGYKGAVTVRPGASRLPEARFSLPRTEISGDDDLWDFRGKLAGAFDPWHRLWQWKTDV